MCLCMCLVFFLLIVFGSQNVWYLCLCEPFANVNFWCPLLFLFLFFLTMYQSYKRKTKYWITFTELLQINVFSPWHFFFFVLCKMIHWIFSFSWEHNITFKPNFFQLLCKNVWWWWRKRTKTVCWGHQEIVMNENEYK